MSGKLATMHRPRYRPLVASLLAAAVLGCDGPGLGGGGGLTPGPFYISGKANIAAGSTGQISFYSGTASDSYDLVVVDPAGTGVNRVAAGGTWAPMASVSQWTTVSASGQASNWGPRYLIYAQAAATGGSTDAPLLLLDLGRTSATAIPSTGTRFSTVTTVTSKLCTFGQASGLVLNDYVTPSNSWVTFRTAGSDNVCNTLDNQTIAIPLTAGASTVPMALGLAEPVEAIHDANGALTGAIELVHILPSDVGTKLPTLQLADAKLKVTASIGTSQPMQGTGNTTADTTADFQSLGIAPVSGVWLYRDALAVRAIRLGAPATTDLLFTLGTSTFGASDVLQTGKAVFDSDGTTAYVAVNNASGTSYIVRINTTAASPTATTVVTETAATSIELVGLTATTGYLAYATAGQPAIKATPKTASNSTAPVTVAALTASQQLDTVPPAMLGDAVYYTLDDNSGGTNPARQAYSAAFTTGGPSAPAAVSATGGSCSAMIHPVYPTEVSITAPAYGSMLLARSASLCQASGQALAYANAALISVATNGTATQVGQMPQLEAQLSNPPANASTALNWVDFGYFFGEPGMAAPVDAPLQSGLPVLLELDGSTAQSAPVADIESFLPGSTSGLIRLTQNLR
jgi:hypothetical protein